jgi:hypothetical protein
MNRKQIEEELMELKKRVLLLEHRCKFKYGDIVESRTTQEKGRIVKIKRCVDMDWWDVVDELTIDDGDGLITLYSDNVRKINEEKV